MRQRAADAPDAVRRRRVQRDHRCALGQAVALVDGNAERHGPLEQIDRDAGAAHRDEAQTVRNRRALPRGRHQRVQHLGNEDDRRRAPARDAAGERGDVESGRTPEADGRERRDRHAGAREQRCIQAGDVLQERRERQHAQMQVARIEDHGLGQSCRDGLLVHEREADPLGRARRARGIGNLGGAGGQRYRCRCVDDTETTVGTCDGERNTARSRSAQHVIDARVADGMRLLRGREERRQRHHRDPRGSRREVGDRPGDAVIERESETPDTCGMKFLSGLVEARGERGV